MDTASSVDSGDTPQGKGKVGKDWRWSQKGKGKGKGLQSMNEWDE